MWKACGTARRANGRRRQGAVEDRDAAVGEDELSGSHENDDLKGPVPASASARRVVVGQGGHGLGRAAPQHLNGGACALVSFRRSPGPDVARNS